MFGSDHRFAKKKREDDTNEWLVTFGDMVTLLLAFFIILHGISRIDTVRYEQMRAGLAQGLGAREISRPIENLQEDIQSMIENMDIDDITTLGQDDRGLVIEFASGAFYRPAEAEVREEAHPILNRLAATLNMPQYQRFQVEVQGHTDDDPIRTERFPSNWELSAARATGVVRFLEAAEVEKTRLLAVGYADIAPKVPNRDHLGNPIRQNQEINRRIAVRIHPR